MPLVCKILWLKFFLKNMLKVLLNYSDYYFRNKQKYQCAHQGLLGAGKSGRISSINVTSEFSLSPCHPHISCYCIDKAQKAKSLKEGTLKNSIFVQ